MSRPKLHLDADTSIKALYAALVERGHDVTRTPNTWMPEDANDSSQLLQATAQGRCILTFNIKDFLALAVQYPQHGGIILAAQSSWGLPNLIKALHRLLSETKAEDWPGQTRWLNQWL
jgi:murein endopeptidase